MRITLRQLKRIIRENAFEINEAPPPIWDEPSSVEWDPKTKKGEWTAKWTSDPARGEPEGESGEMTGPVSMYKDKPIMKPPAGDLPLEYDEPVKTSPGSRRSWTGQLVAQLGDDVARAVRAIDPEFASAPAGGPGGRGKTKASKLRDVLVSLHATHKDSPPVTELLDLLQDLSLGFAVEDPRAVEEE